MQRPAEKQIHLRTTIWINREQKRPSPRPGRSTICGQQGEQTETRGEQNQKEF